MPEAELLRNQTTACKKALCITLLAKPSIRFLEFGVLGNEHATMLLGYSFAVRPNSRALGTAGSVMTIFGVLINRCTHSKNQLEESKQDWLVQTFGLRRRRRLADAIQAECPPPPPSIKKRKKGSRDRVTLHPLQSMFDLTSTAPDQWRYKSDRPLRRGLHHLLFSNDVTGDVYGWRRQGQLVIANTQRRDNHGRHDLSLWRFDVGRYSRLCNVIIFNSLRKRPIFRDAISGFPSRKWRLRNERRNSILMTCHYPDLGSALDWSCSVGNLLQPIAGTTQFWIVTCHQYQDSHCFKPLKFFQDLFKFSMTF